MKVKELIELLKHVNPDAELVADINGGTFYVIDEEETEEQNDEEYLQTCSYYALIGERMSQAVAKLYMQARKNITARNTYESPAPILQEFAELIIRECANIAWNNEPDGTICELIKQEFGIKE